MPGENQHQVGQKNEDDYMIVKATWSKEQKAIAVAPATVPEPDPMFEEIDGEDPDDRSIRKAQFNKAMKLRAAGGGPTLAPAAPTSAAKTAAPRVEFQPGMSGSLTGRSEDEDDDDDA